MKRIGNKYTPKAIVSPTTKDLHWAAGFLEGEGCFYSKGNSSVIKASQNEIEPLTKLQHLFGGSIKKLTAPKCKQGFIWIWSTYGPRATGIMMTLYSILSYRRKLSIVKSLREGGYLGTNRKVGKTL